jgi:hypothetical protein
MSSHINYRELFFQHPALTKIAGDPTYTSLAKLEPGAKQTQNPPAVTWEAANKDTLVLSAPLQPTPALHQEHCSIALPCRPQQ